MPYSVPVLYERERGCGFRKVGGLYLVNSTGSRPCSRFPIPVSVCPCCNHGIKPARGFTWVDGDALKSVAPECLEAKSFGKHALYCLTCPMSPEKKLGRVGLIWIGERFYPTPQDFLAEAKMMGVSRRISAIPRGLMTKNEQGEMVLSETWLFMAHRRAIIKPVADRSPHDEDTPMWEWAPGIVCIWKPDRIEKVVSRETPEEEIEKLVKRGIQPVIVEHQQNELFEQEEVGDAAHG